MKKTLIALLTCFCALTLKAGIQVTTVADSTVKSPDPIEGSNNFEIDFNNDGTIDIIVAAKFFLGNEGPHPPYNCHVVEIDSTGLNMVSCGPFLNGDIIDSNLIYGYSETIFGGIQGKGGVGAWYLRLDNVESTAYIGTMFYIGNDIHYGWIMLKTNGYTFSITSYAYNDIAGQAIIAGQQQ